MKNRANWWVGNLKKALEFYNKAYNFEPGHQDFQVISNMDFAILCYDPEEGLKFDSIKSRQGLKIYCDHIKEFLKLPKSELEYY